MREGRCGLVRKDLVDAETIVCLDWFGLTINAWQILHRGERQAHLG